MADDFCAALVHKGFHVARFDNRDAGRSSRATAKYSLADLADDALAIIDEIDTTAG